MIFAGCGPAVGPKYTFGGKAAPWAPPRAPLGSAGQGSAAEGVHAHLHGAAQCIPVGGVQWMMIWPCSWCSALSVLFPTLAAAEQRVQVQSHFPPAPLAREGVRMPAREGLGTHRSPARSGAPTPPPEGLPFSSPAPWSCRLLSSVCKLA